MAKTLESSLELDLVNEAQNGNSSAFGQLYDAHIKKIYDFIYYKTMHKDIAEDITSDVFMKAWRNINQFSGDSFTAWLYKIARNSVIDYYRSRKNLINIEDCWDLESGNDLLASLDQTIKAEEIKKAMQDLKSRDREIIIMRIWQDLSFKEIAECLGQNEGAVKMAFGRAISRLKTKVPLSIFILWPYLLSLSNK